MIEARNLGETPGFPQHDLRDELAVGRKNFVEEKPEQRAKLLERGRGLGAFDRKLRQHRPERLQDDLFEKIGLVARQQVDRALGDAGALGNVVEPRAFEAFFGEFGERRVEDRLAAVFGADFPLRGAFRGGGRQGLPRVTLK